MNPKIRRTAICLGLALCITALPSVTQEAGAFIFFPIFFPPISDCGTVVLVDSTFPFPGGDSEGGCLAWVPDSGGGAFLVAGLEAFEVGDRIHVSGQNCFTCLTTCAAGAILNSTIKACD